jgi:Peptidase family M28
MYAGLRFLPESLQKGRSRILSRRPTGEVSGIVIVFLCLVVSTIIGVAPARAQSRIDPIDLLQGVKTLSSDAFSGRKVGSEGGALARNYLHDRLTTLDVSICGSAFEHEFSLNGRDGQQQTGVNLIGIIEGTRDTDHYLVLSAHYDHLGKRNNQVYNGADDNASGTSAVLAIAEALQKKRPEHSVLIALFDAEEQGSRGARAFIDAPCIPLSSIWMNVNLDMVSRSASRELYISGTYYYPELRPLLDDIGGDRPVSVLFGHDTPGSGHDDWTDASDHGPFHRVGIPYIYFGVEDHPGYHKPSDDFSEITPAFYIDAVEIILDAVYLMDENLDGIHEINPR